MEKIKIDFKIDIAIYTLSQIIFFIIYFILFKVNLAIFIMSSIFVFTIFLIVFLSEKYKYHGIYFNSDGIISNGEIISWSDVNIKMKNKYYIDILIKNLHYQKNITIKLNTIKSFVYLVSRYCPKHYDLYKEIKEYSIKNKIKFL